MTTVMSWPERQDGQLAMWLSLPVTYG